MRKKLEEREELQNIGDENMKKVLDIGQTIITLFIGYWFLLILLGRNKDR